MILFFIYKPIRKKIDLVLRGESFLTKIENYTTSIKISTRSKKFFVSIYQIKNKTLYFYVNYPY